MQPGRGAGPGWHGDGQRRHAADAVRPSGPGTPASSSDSEDEGEGHRRSFDTSKAPPGLGERKGSLGSGRKSFRHPLRKAKTFEGDDDAVFQREWGITTQQEVRPCPVLWLMVTALEALPLLSTESIQRVLAMAPQGQIVGEAARHSL